MPSNFPKFPPEFFTDVLPHLSDAQIAAILLRQYIPDGAIAEQDEDTELLAMMEKALSFGLPLEQLDPVTFLLRLDQGPTASFKDIAARILAGLMEKYCEKTGKHITLVVATSGDTGVAIADAFGDSKWINVTILYPHGGVSEVQEKQMVDAAKRFKNVQAIPVKGSFDDAQNVAKLLLDIRDINLDGNVSTEVSKLQRQIRQKLIGTVSEHITPEQILEIARLLQPLGLSSANSINPWRWLPQMTQYFAAYRDLIKNGVIQPGQKIAYAVPSGNVGHLMAGLTAEEMGLPVERFIVGTNTNNIFANMIQRGVIAHTGLHKTASPSMDILDPSNVERIFTLAARHTNFTGTIDYDDMKKAIKDIEEEYKRIHEELEDCGSDGMRRARLLEESEKLSRHQFKLTDFGVTEEMLAYLQGRIWVKDVNTDQEVYDTMEQVYDKTGEVLDTHGTVGYIAARSAREEGELPEGTIIVCFDTAHPDKFPVALEKAHIPEGSHPAHPKLEEVMKTVDLEKDRPEVMELNILAIARQIAEHAGECITSHAA